MKEVRFIFIFFSIMLLISCEAHTRKQNVGLGALIGGAMGGATGMPFIMLPGAVIGAVGGYVMESSDDVPQYKKPPPPNNVTVKEVK